MYKYFVSFKYFDYDIFGNTIIELDNPIKSIKDIVKIEQKIMKQQSTGECFVLLYFKELEHDK